MPKLLKIIRYIAYAGFALLIPAAVILLGLLHSTAFKHQLEKMSSASFALEVTINGALASGFTHGLQLSLPDVHMRKQGIDIAAVRMLTVGIDLLPLLRGEIRLNHIALQDPVIALVRHQDGSYNFTHPQPQVTLNLAQINISNANIHLQDTMTDTEYSAASCNLVVSGSTPLDRASLQNITALDITAHMDCAQLRKSDLLLTNVKLALAGNSGVFRFHPLTMDLFGAHATGSLLANLGGAQPQYELDYALPQFLVEESFTLLAPQHSVTGTMDFFTHLTAQGNTLPELKQTLGGHISLAGRNLILNGSNLDEQLAEYETTRHFSLIDAGAFLFAGPLGLVATKGYDFANIVDKSGTSSEIHAVVSQWNVAAGVARAEDVAMTTDANLIALDGELDFPNGQFRNMTIALLDKKGCARIAQAVGGSFQHPEIAKPGLLSSLAAPVLTLLHKLDPDEECAVFYTGSLAVQP